MKNLLPVVLVLSAALCLSACCGNSNSTVPRVVTRISISCDGDTRTCVSDESMEAMLTYLRLLAPVTPADPAAPQGAFYRIRLIYSDGTQKEYAQQGCCFREDDGDWEIITDRDSLALAKLFDLLEPETIPSAI